MRVMRKISAVLLAMVMTVLMAVSAFAADGPYDRTITITNTNGNHTYTAYQIFEGRLEQDNETEAYILSDIEWGSGVDATTEKNGRNLVAALKADEVLAESFPNDSYSASQVAEVLESFSENSDELDAFARVVSNYLSGTGTMGSYNSENGSYTITGLEAGYYIVTDSMTAPGEGEPENDAYSKFMLKLTTDVTVTPKSSVPSVEKKVRENSYTNNDSNSTGSYSYGAGYNDVADWNIGDHVPFKLIGTLPSTLADYDVYSYTFHDTLSAGLTYNAGSVKVSVVNPTEGVYGGDDGVSAAEGTDVTGQFSITAEENELTITCEDITALTDVTIDSSSLIVVEYTATLNEAAVVGSNGNTNEVYLEFSNDPNPGGTGETGTTPTDQVIVFTYGLDVTKVDSENTETPLEGAEFILYKKDGSNNNSYYQAGNTGSDSQKAFWTANENDAAKLTSDESGSFSVTGLDEGTYYLKETKAPEGYNLLKADIMIVITANAANIQNWTSAMEGLTGITVSVDEGDAVAGNTGTGMVSITVENVPGSALPETGGIGTTIFYVVGGILVIGAGVILIARRRTRSDKE